MTEESYLGKAENTLSPEELEKQKKKDLETLAKADHFKALVETSDWKEVEKVLKEDAFMNLRYDKQWLRMCWGIKMTVDRIHAWAAHADELRKKLAGGEN